MSASAADDARFLPNEKEKTQLAAIQSLLCRVLRDIAGDAPGLGLCGGIC